MTRWKSTILVIGVTALILISIGVGVVLWKRRVMTSPASFGNSEMETAAATTPSDNAAAAQLTPEEQQQIGLQIAEVRRESMSDEVSAIGRVEEPESALSTVSSRYGGRVDRLFLKFTGQAVQAGDPVAAITITGQPLQKDEPFSATYSPGLIAAIAEYKFAVENQQHAHASSRPDAAAQADALVQASRVRMDRWGLTPEQIDTAVASPQKPLQMTISAPVTGIVRSRKVSEGQFVNPGDPLVELTDLGSVWVKAQVFDADIARIAPGMTAQITSEAISAKLRGKVIFIEPQSDPLARTTPVRIQVDNPETRLKPGMVVQTFFQIPLGNVLTVPDNSVIDTGMGKIVYVARDNGVFERRIIHVGPALRDKYPVMDGLRPGEKIVTNGAFLVDSQTRLSGGMTGLFGGSKSFSESGVTASSEYRTTFRISPDPPAGGVDNTIHVALTDRAGKSVSDAQVKLTFIMPAMPSMGMPEMRNSADLKWDGKEYSGPFHVTMAGPWNVVVEARRGTQPISVYRTNLNAR